ncbi:MAG TPA: hypothetical protein VNN06_08135 [Ramlibacter sp.]|nr:hypothetical protein [Ramlibacter sp.]
MVVVALVEPVTPAGPAMEPPPLGVEPGAPIELVLPGASPLVDPGVVVPLVLLPIAPEPPVVALPMAEPPVVAPPVALELPVPPVAGEPLLEVDVSLPGAGVVVDEPDDEVGAGVVASRLVQAPSETAATSASAAHVVRDAFIRNSLRLIRK